MRVSDYPFGKVRRRLKNAVYYLNKNKARLIEENTLDGELLDFDYPDYFGLPKSISYKLNSDEVDWLQYEISSWTKTVN